MVVADYPFFLRSRSRGLSGVGPSTSARRLFEGEQLFGAEGLVVDLSGSFDQVLQMSPQQEITEVDEFAVPLVFDVDDTPPVLTSADGLSVDDDVAL